MAPPERFLYTGGVEDEFTSGPWTGFYTYQTDRLERGQGAAESAEAEIDTPAGVPASPAPTARG